MEKLKARWGIEHNWEILVILIVFSVTGSSATLLAKPVLEFIGISKETNDWFVFWPIRILLMFIIYQFLLVTYGWLFGQFNFFWNMEKKMLSRLGFKRFFKDEKGQNVISK